MRGLTGFTRFREERDLKSHLPNKKVGALHPPDSCQAEQPFWSPGRNRGRTNDGSACRPLFMRSPHIASRSMRLSDQIRHGYDLVLDCTVTPAMQIQFPMGCKSLKWLGKIIGLDCDYDFI